MSLRPSLPVAAGELPVIDGLLTFRIWLMLSSSFVVFLVLPPVSEATPLDVWEEKLFSKY